MDDSNFKKVVKEIEILDEQFQREGISDEYREKWEVTVNVGLWIVGRKTAEWLHDRVLEFKPAIILELGTSVGYSALWMGKAASSYGGHLHTVDREPFKTKEARAYLERAGLGATVTCYTSEIEDFLKNSWEQPVDFLFIDAGKREYLDYVNGLMPFLKKGSVIVADNIGDFPEHTRNYREFMENDPRFETSYVDLEDGLLLSKKL